MRSEDTESAHAELLKPLGQPSAPTDDRNSHERFKRKDCSTLELSAHSTRAKTDLERPSCSDWRAVTSVHLLQVHLYVV